MTDALPQLGPATRREPAAPYWTSFPLHALPQTNWADHADAHRAVMRLFSPRLPGPKPERRSHAGVLYRLDPQPDATINCLIQSAQAPELLPPNGRVLTVPTVAWTIPAGQHIMLRVAVNPITRRTVKEPGTTRRTVTATLPTDDTGPWLANHLASALEIEHIINHTRTITTARRSTRDAPPRIIVDTLDAIAVVRDTTQLQHLRTNGIGRAKAYGCGLLTAVPIA